MQKYCHNCGKQVQVGSKFCHSCGTNLNSLANVPDVVRPVISQFPAFSPGDGDDDGEAHLDRLHRAPIRQKELFVDIVKDNNTAETFGSIISQSQQGIGAGEPVARAPIGSVSSDAFMAEFRKEAGTSRAN